MSKSRGRLSTNFRIEEFDCHDGTAVPTAAVPALRRWCEVWGEPLRLAFGPVRITSGFRTPSYNRSVGGATASYHVYTLGSARGVAADCVPARGTVQDWIRWATRQQAAVARTVGNGRGALHGYERQGFIHLDTGPARTWAG